LCYYEMGFGHLSGSSCEIEQTDTHPDSVSCLDSEDQFSRLTPQSS
jgi:hypothetical protein